MALSDEERDQQVFMALVHMLSENAMMALGKIVPPGASEPHTDLDAAQSIIDILDVLKKRTKGNLAERESRWLEVQLTNLRLNFLDTQKAAGASAGAGGSKPGGG